MVDRVRLPDAARAKSAVWFLFPAVLFFVSGACGLLYQVVWTRKLVLLFGTTAYAVSTVLAVFFIGLGLGSLAGGRWADRTRRPLFLYGFFELLIGMWALLFIFTVDPAESFVVGILRQWTSTRMAGVAVRAVLASAWLIVPVVLMGATLPLLAKAVVWDTRTRGRRIGVLYSLNTFGAMAGCAATGFIILPALGYTRTTWVGAAANLTVGVLAMAVGRAGSGQKAADAPEETVPDAGPASSAHAYAALLLAAYAVIGCCALAYEVLWTRLLAMIFLGTTYAFTTMLTTLLFGIAAGSAVSALFVDRRGNAGTRLGGLMMLMGSVAVALLVVFARLPEWLQQMQLDAGYQWPALVRIKFLLSFLVLFPPTFLSGMTFPVIVRAITESRGRLGRDVGRLYAANTLGGVAGAILGGFVIIPAAGTHRGLVVLSAVLMAMGALVILANRRHPLKYRAVWLGAGAAAAVGAFAVAPGDVTQSLNNGYIPNDQRLLFYTEGTEGSVAVSGPVENDIGTDRTLWINAVQATASIEKGVRMNRFQGVLPLLFDRDPRRVLFMCFGSGITAGTLGIYSYEQIDAVEISPEVIQAAPYFKLDNFNVLENPKVRFHIDDGRNFLLTTNYRYDVITFEPMPLAMAGVSTFYTEDYYRLCMERLAPGGIVSQWVPLHSLNSGLVRSLVCTFISVFPEYCAWFINADLFLVGSNQPLWIDYARAAARLNDPAIRQALSQCGLKDIEEVITCFFMGKQGLLQYAGNARIMTDDRPWAEFLAPKLMYERTVEDTLQDIAPYFETPTAYMIGADESVRQAIDRRHQAKALDLEGLKLYYGGSFGSEPELFFKQALAIDPNDHNARYYLKEITLSRVKLFKRWGEPEKSTAILTDALKYASDLPELWLELGHAAYDISDYSGALYAYMRYVESGGLQDMVAGRIQELRLKGIPNSADK